jgi:hypothetical protein
LLSLLLPKNIKVKIYRNIILLVSYVDGKARIHNVQEPCAEKDVWTGRLPEIL